MVIRTGKFVSSFITPLNPKSIQPNGVDLHIQKISCIQPESNPILKDNEIKHVELVSIDCSTDEFYNLKNRYAYRIVYREIVKIPESCVGLMIVRSSLQRNGVWLSTALWDSGYEGRGSSTLFCFANIKIHRDFAVGQLVFMDAEKPDQLYTGRYQHEGIIKTQ